MLDLHPGAVALSRRTYTQRDFDRFAALSGDDNPIHVDSAFAARTRFGRTVAHGMLLYSSLCGALTDALGTSIVQLEQELIFASPTYTDEEVIFRLEVATLDPHGAWAELNTLITRPGGETACQGRARVALQAGDVTLQARGLPTARQVALDGTPPATPDQGVASYKGMALGQRAQTTRTFIPADLREYRDLAGDTNHAYADATVSSGGPALQVPGGLLGGLFSFLLGTQLPGRGTNWLKQRLIFPAPCAVGETVLAWVEVARLRPEKELVNLRCVCTGEAPGAPAVCVGEALVLVKDLDHG